MTTLSSSRLRLLDLSAIVLATLALFAYAGLRSGPLAPVAVTVARVESGAIAPALFGIGTVAARQLHRIGPTSAGRIAEVRVEPGDAVVAGQLLARIEPLDLDARVLSQEAGIRRATAAVVAADAQQREAMARHRYAQEQAQRYAGLFAKGLVSAEATGARREEAAATRSGVDAADAARDVAKQELDRLRAETAAVVRQRENLELFAPVDGIVTQRLADPGTTVVAGQAILDVVAPESIWIDARFDQQRARGLASGLEARIALRSRAGDALAGHVARIEPQADAVTEELHAKIAFASLPAPLPPLGELAEVTLVLAAAPASPFVSNASLQRIDGVLGVWRVVDGELHYTPVRIGAADLDGRVPVLDGLRVGEQVVVHSQKALTARARIRVVDRIDRPTP